MKCAAPGAPPGTASQRRTWPRTGETWPACARFADAVLICTQDRMHVELAEAFAAAGYHILLEKPMAPDEAGCRRIAAAVEKAGVMLAVGDVMRYTPYTRAVRQVVGSGQLGDIMSVEHLEPVGFGTRPTPTSAATGGAPAWRPPCCWPSPATTWTGWPASLAGRRCGRQLRQPHALHRR